MVRMFNVKSRTKQCHSRSFWANLRVLTLATCRALVGPQMAIHVVHTEPTGRGPSKLGYILGCCTLFVIAQVDLRENTLHA